MTFEELILSIIDNNSGGVKMTTLVVEVVSYLGREFQAGELAEELKSLLVSPRLLIDALNHKLKQMEANGKIGFLCYGWPMGDIVREKVFVYLPLE